MLLEKIVPPGALARDDRRLLACPQPQVFAAIQQVCPAEIRGFSLAGALIPFEAKRPLYAQMLGAGYSVLGTVPLREVVIGRVGPWTRPFAAEPRVRDRRAFTEYSERGHIKVALGFLLARAEVAHQTGTEVTAALRLWDAASGNAGALRAAWPALGRIAGIAAGGFLAALAARVGG